MAACLGWCVIRFWHDIIQIDAALLTSSWLAILGATGLSVLNYALRIIRWHAYMGALGHRLPIRFVALTFLAGFAFTLSPGKLGEMVRARYYQARGVPITTVSSAFFVERILDLMAMVILALGILLHAGTYQGLAWTASGLIVSCLMLVACLPWLSIATKLEHSDPNGPRHPLVAGAARTLAASQQLLKPGLLLPGLLLGVVSWGGEAMGLKMVADAMAPDQLSWSGASGAYALAILAGALSFLPGGLGSTEAVMTGILMSQGIEASTAILLTLVCRALTLWLAVLIGWGCVWLLRHEPTSF